MKVRHFFILPALLIVAALAHAQAPTVIPEEARRYYVEGNTLYRTAQSNSDYEQAIALYRQALAIDPRFGNAWYNLSKVQEKLERYDDAIASLKQFIAASPNDPEARTAQDHEYELEALKGKAESPEGKWASFLQRLEGGVWTSAAVSSPGNWNSIGISEVKNGKLIVKTMDWSDQISQPDPRLSSSTNFYNVLVDSEYNIESRIIKKRMIMGHTDCGYGTYEISEDQETITFSYSCLGNTWVTPYKRRH